jgi:ATP-dependent DNA helicase RecQ
VSEEEFRSIEQVLMSTLQQQSLSAAALLKSFSGIKKEKAWKVLQFLQAENKIEVNQLGLVTMR